MLGSNVVIVWPELANAGPTMVGYVALRCCDRLAGAEGARGHSLEGERTQNCKKTDL